MQPAKAFLEALGVMGQPIEGPEQPLAGLGASLLLRIYYVRGVGQVGQLGVGSSGPAECTG